MSFSIRKHRLLADGRAVDLLLSPNTGGLFAETPRLLVIHFTSGGSARSSAEWFRAAENRSSSAHLVIDRDGSALQCVPFDTVAWHAGRSQWKGVVGLNRHALGIELANWGDLTRRGSAWVTGAGVPIADPVLAVHHNGNPDGSRAAIGWEPYPEAQMRALTAIARALASTYGIDEILGHDDIAPTRKWDPGPAFDMDRFRTLVLGERGVDDDRRLTVQVASGLNLRRGPGLQYETLKLLPQGTMLDPEKTAGSWVQVTVIDAQGRPDQTGWVHGRYIG